MKAKPPVMHEEEERGHSCPPSAATEDPGPLPASWRAAPMGDFLTVAQYGMSVKGGPEGRCPILRMTNQVNGSISPTKLQYAEITDREPANFCVQRGDILFNRTNSLELVGRTSVFDIPGEFVFASYLIRLRTLPDQLDPFFLNLYLNADATQKRLKSTATRGVSQSNISATRLRTFTVPVPPLPEQQKIAAELGMVGRAMEQQERLLALTAELKKTLLHQLFTQGLRHEPQKQTDIGPVPESWELMPLGSLAKVGNGSTPKRDNEAYWNGGTIPWLNSARIHDRFITEPDQFVTDLAAKECHLPRVKPNSLLIAITGQGKTLGNSALTRFETCINQHLAYAQFTSDKVMPEFVLWFMQTRYNHLRSIAQAAGSTKGALTCGYLKTYPIPVPTIEEQTEIAKVFTALDAKEQSHHRKHATLSTLFRTLLHQLMTAQIRLVNLSLQQ